VLVSDFWGACNAVACALRQTCLVHLIRKLEQTEKYKSLDGDWDAFSKKLRRLLGDAIRLWRRREELKEATYQSRRTRLTQRLKELVAGDWSSVHSKRLLKRLRRHQDDLFTFFDVEGVPFENNSAERAIRPAVIIRKNSYGNRSEVGSDCQSVLMSVFRTLKQRGQDPIGTLVTALREYLTTGTFPPLPTGKTTSDC